ncbi:YxeA family protein [Staphylococcus capitis]|uniref:YxeA family protein n=1 Tax=Staphylococcus capitis TaxID=29388 RepID=UPI00066A7B74|nr:YxeA family protein [Staphylococcus capitis]MBC3087638.1 YxeA family protein [Staphylococcus capitis]MCK6221647.1 YxeA family protein [Staphylococcus capitis]
MKALKISLTTVVVIILLLVGLLFGLKVYGDHHPGNGNVKSLNMANPLEPTKEYYVKTTKPMKHNPKGFDEDSNVYKTTGYDDKGNSKKITYMGMKKLKPNHYLKIKEKLGTVKSYEEVKEDKIPKKAMSKLEK